jgi:hypothetical protein
MSVRQWRALRDQFLKAMPSVVTVSHIASALSMGEPSGDTRIFLLNFFLQSLSKRCVSLVQI